MSMPEINLDVLDRDVVLNNIIASIALQEAALSHILNADGEKLQAAVQMVDPANADLFDEVGAVDQPTLDELLLVNESVSTLVDHVTDYERSLRDKLNAILTFIRSEEDLPETFRITIAKEDDDSNALPGAIFSVSGRVTMLSGDVISVHQLATSNASGDLVFTLPAGEYTLREIKAPDGFILDDFPRTLTVTGDDAYTVVPEGASPVTIINEPEPPPTP